MTKKNKITLGKILVAAMLFAASVVFDKQHTAALLLSYAAYFTVGYDVMLTAVKKLFRGRALDDNFLMTIASLGAVLIGEMHEGVFVMLFYKVGELFENLAVDHSRRSITTMLEAMPASVTLLRDGQEITAEPDTVEVGDILIVKAGEKVAVDGVILEGFADMDTSAITGESAPRAYGEGDEVISGFVSMNGSIRLRATKAFSDSTICKILELVESATMKKANTEKFISKFANVYTPIVVSLAVLIALVPMLLSGFSEVGIWLHRAFVFLVVSCPCALVISVPLGFFGGIGKASRAGILIKGSTYIELLSRVHTVAFDKTGTLTSGEFAIQSVITNHIEQKDLLKLAGAIEAKSAHKLAKAVVSVAGAPEASLQIQDFEEISGFGIRAVYNGKPVLCGSRRLLENNKILSLPQPVASTCIYVAIDGEFAGRIELEDALRNHAKETVDALTRFGVKKLVMLTGDLAANAEKIGNEVGIETVVSGLLPAEKVEQIEQLLPEGVVVFVGDGINDAPVLCRADVGIAMGAMGSDAAIEAADIVLLDDDIKGVSDALKISRQTMNIVKQNIVFALSVKLIILVLGALGISGMWEAAFADVGVSVLAILNTMRLMLSTKRSC